MAFRIDIGSLRSPERLPDGRLRVDGYLTRTGVFEYRNADGSTRREYRPEGEVFKADSVETFRDAIVTEDHPPEMISARNARAYQVGMISGAPRRDGKHVAATIVVNDAATIAKLERGEKNEISCGYECDLEAAPGVSPEGERYDAVQRNIRGNHVALVPIGRAGPTARVRMDAAEMIPSSENQTMTVEDLKAALAAETSRADSLQAKLDALPPALAANAAKKKAAAEGDDEDSEESDDDKPAFLKKKLAKSDAAVKAIELKLAEAETALAAERSRADAAVQARTDAEAGSMAAARARLALEGVAGSILGSEFKADASNRELMVAVVKKLDGDDVPAERSDDYVAARYDGATRRRDAGADALAGLRAAVIPPVRADQIPDEDAAARKMREDSANAWKTKEK
jgi:hypothetical protein